MYGTQKYVYDTRPLAQMHENDSGFAHLDSSKDR